MTEMAPTLTSAVVPDPDRTRKRTRAAAPGKTRGRTPDRTLGHVVVVNIFFAPYSYGGATVVAEQVAQALQRNHATRVTAISVVNRPDIFPYSVMKVERDGIQNYLINLPHGRDYAEHYSNPRVTEIVSGLLDSLQPDLLHAHCIQEIGAGILSMAKRRGLPVVLSVHDFWWICERQFMIRPSQRYCAQDPVKIENCAGCVDNLPRARLRLEALRAEAAQVDLMTFPSAFARDLTARSGITAARQEIWENGVPLPGDGFFAAQAARRARDKRLVFGFVGGPSQIKGWPLIKSAFEAIGRDDFAGYLVDGSMDGSWWGGEDISRMKGDWQIYPRFKQDEMDAFYAEIDVLLFLSQWKETFGLSIREAMGRGIRVIQTDSGGTTEFDGADRSEMLQIGDGPKKLQRKLEKLLAAPYQPPQPRAVTSYADQARRFVELVTPLL
jgi:glycosyltransferase involved in cell wall biosynthesis